MEENTPNNQYNDMSAMDAMKLVRSGNMLLPDIQRSYVWETDEIEKLFESIVDDYPIGACIFWKTDRSTLNAQKPNLFRFLTSFRKDGAFGNEPAPKGFDDDGPYYIVLDGQQRITSLRIGLYGSYTYYKGGRGRSRSNRDNWIEKTLCYDLSFYTKEKTEEGDEPDAPQKRFRFCSSEEIKGGSLLKISELAPFRKEEREAFSELLSRRTADERATRDLTRLFDRLHDGGHNALVHHYCIEASTYDRALDVFVRVNSTGKKLSKSDLLFSTLINDWRDSEDVPVDGRRAVDNLIETMNQNGKFRFDRNYLMRLALVLSDQGTGLKIEAFTREAVTGIRNRWEDIKAAAKNTAFLLRDLGFCDERLASYNATMPLAYYIYKGGSFRTVESKEEARKFLAVAMAKRLFGVASNDALSRTREVLSKTDCKKQAFFLSLFDSLKLTGNRAFTVSGSDIDYWLDNYEIGRSTFILLSLLYPELKLGEITFEQDHCHPRAGFEGKSIAALELPPETVAEWQRKRNLLPNLELLEGGENAEKNKTPLIEWVGRDNDFKYRPTGVSLELGDFDAFFDARRALMKAKLLEIFDVTP